MNLIPRPNIDARRSALHRKVPRWLGYLTRLYSIEQDLDAIIQACGKDFTHWLVNEIAAGNTYNIRHEVDMHLKAERKRRGIIN